MANNIIANIGVDNFENIVYLARIISKLGKKVLVVDHSETRSIAYSIPKISGINIYDDIITYRKVDFTSKLITNEDLQKYDDIFIAYGFNDIQIDINFCNKTFIALNLFQNNITRVNQMDFYIMPQDTTIIIRDFIETKISVEWVINELKKYTNPRNVYELSFNEKDYINSINVQYNKVFMFDKISKHLKLYLLSQVKELYPDITEKKIKQAFEATKKGD